MKTFIIFLALVSSAMAQPFHRVYYTPFQCCGTDTLKHYDGNNGSQPDSVMNSLLSIGKIAGIPVVKAYEVSSPDLGFTQNTSIRNYPSGKLNPAPIQFLLPTQTSADSAVHVLTSAGATSNPTWSNVPVAAGGTGATTFTAAMNNLGSYNLPLAAWDTTTSQTLAAIPGMGFTVGANQKWDFTFYIKDSSSTTNGIEFGLLIPDTSCHPWRATAFGSTATAGATFRWDDIIASATATGAYTTVAGVGFVKIFGTITTGPATAGTLSAEMLKVTSGTAIATAPGSYFVATRTQ